MKSLKKAEKYYDELLCRFRSRVNSGSVLKENSLSYWRVNILFTILLTGLAFCSFAMVTAILLVIKEKVWSLMIFDVLAYGLCVFLLFSHRLNYEIRASIILLMCYMIGLVVIISVGPVSGGPIWLFSFAVLVSVLLGAKAAIGAVAINSITLMIIAWLISTGKFGQGFPFFNSPQAMIVAITNFIVLNLITSMSIAVLVKGLISTNQKEKESEAKFRGLAENSFDVIFMTDDQGYITYVSPACENLLQYKPAEVEGKLFTDFLPEYEVPKLIKRFNEKMQDKDSRSIEFDILKKDGKCACVEVNSSRRYKNGEVEGTQGIIRDITQRKEMEARLLNAQKMESIGTLAGGIAHDFNNILGIILGNTELAIDDVPEWSPIKNYLREIRLASLRAKDVVGRILSVARKTPADRKPIQVSTIVKESLRLMRATIPATTEIRPEVLCASEMILANPTEINQVLMNLCTNSVHAMEGDTVTLDVHSAALYEDLAAGDYIKLCVEDSGSGIDPDIMDRIFDSYFTTKDVDKGTGMGLAVVYGIIKKHEGAIKISSRPGRGTAVEVLFPLIEGKVEGDIKESETLTMGAGRILFVDDEEPLVQLAKQMLERQGYTVITKTSSVEALDLFKYNPDQFDLVITDLAMPKMAGDRLALELMKIRPDIPIILSTGHSERIDETRAQEMGIKAFIMKPFEKRALAKTVQMVLENRDD